MAKPRLENHPLQTKSLQTKRLLACSSILLLTLSGCANLPKTMQQPKAVTEIKPKPAQEKPLGAIEDLAQETQQSKSLSIRALLVKASESSSPRREIFLLQATNKSLQEQKIETAEKIFEVINPIDISSENNVDYFYHLVGLNLAIHMTDLEQTQARLNDLDIISNQRRITLAPQSYLLDTTLRAEALAILDSPMSAARLLVYRLSGLNEANYNTPETHNFIWQLLSQHRAQEAKKDQQSPIEIGIGASETPSHELQAWLELSSIMGARQKMSISDTQDSIKQWSQNWIMTRVARTPPAQISRLIQNDFQLITQLAVLLPETGAFQHASKAIRDGLMTAHYNQDASGPFAPEITFYDTSAEGVDIKNLYQNALDQGAEFVIGPLKKSNVSELGTLEEVPVPILALNYRNEKSPRVLTGVDQLFEFGLKAEDEAEAVANFAIDQGHTRAMILRPDTPWGERVAQAFINEWQNLDGKLLLEQKYTQPRAFSKEVESMLGIAESKRRHKAMERKTGKELEFTPRRRKDIDFILLLASPNEARQLKPTINFHYGEDIPVYATSHIYEGSANPTFDKDLNGIIFADMPWVINKAQQDIYLNADASTSNSSQFQRLFALGIDAYEIMQNFPRVRLLNETEIPGSTGTLILNAGKVKRKVVFGVFENGEVQPYTP